MKPFEHFSNEILMVLESAGGCCEAVCVVLQCIFMMFRYYFGFETGLRNFQFAGLRQPLAGRWRPHRKPLKLRGFDLKVRFDCSIARLLDAGGWLRLRAGGWLRLSWGHLNSGGRFACWFGKVAGWLRYFPGNTDGFGISRKLL